MNKNIEVINNKLWAVNFSLIPFISEISYTPDPNFKPYTELGRMLDDRGVILLNKEHAGFGLAKETLLKAMTFNIFKIKKIVQKLSKLKDKNLIEIITYTAYLVELERRDKAKREKGAFVNGRS